MKRVVVFFIIGLSVPSFAQETWRDTVLMARKLYKNKDYGKAYEYYKSIQNSVPEEVDLSDEMAQSAYKARSFKEAEEIYTQKNTTTNNEVANKMHNVGNARMSQKDYAGAVEAYKDALRANPKDERTRYNLSEAMKKWKDQQSQKKKQNQQDSKQQQGGQGNKQKQNNSQNPQNSSNSEKTTPKTGQLSDRAIEKALDEVMKKEAQTKQRMNSRTGKNKAPKSGKDW